MLINLCKITEVSNKVKRLVGIEMPKAKVTFVAADNNYIYFDVIAKFASDNKIFNLKQKFELLSERNSILYKAEFRYEYSK